MRPTGSSRRVRSQPINLALIPNYADVFEGLKNQPHNTVDGVPYGVPHGRGANLLLFNTEVVTPGARQLVRGVRSGVARTPARSPPMTAPSTSRTRPST